MLYAKSSFIFRYFEGLIHSFFNELWLLYILNIYELQSKLKCFFCLSNGLASPFFIMRLSIDRDYIVSFFSDL